MDKCWAKFVDKEGYLENEYLYKINAGASGVMVMSLEMDTTNRVRMQDKAICISYSINTFGECMNPTILP